MPLPASVAPAPALETLEDCVRHGLEHDPGLRAAFQRAVASTERAQRAGTLPDPRLTWVEFVEELQTRTGPNERRLQLEQRFPWPGTLGARERVADEQAEREARVAEARAVAVRERIELAWHELVLAAERLRVTRDSVALARGLLPVVQRRVESGGPREDLLRLEIELASLERDLATEEQREAPLLRRLAASAGCMPEQLPVRVTAAAAALSGEREAWLRAAREANPTLAVLAAEAERGAAAVDLAARVGRPDLGLGVQYLDVDDALDPATPGSGDDPFAVSLSVSLPVWRASYRAERRAAESELRAAQLALADRREDVEADVATRWFELEDARRGVALYRDVLLPRARETYDLTLSSYSAGSAALTDLILAERRVLDFELALARAVRDRDVAATHLVALTAGGPTP